MTSFLADIDWRGFADMTLPVIAVTLSLSIPIVAIIVDHFQKKAKMHLVEKAIEHGVDISELKLDVNECKTGPRLPYRAGMVTLAVGVALVIAGKFVLSSVGFLYILTMIGGAICACVGLALLINDWMNRDKLRAQQPPGSSGPIDLSR